LGLDLLFSEKVFQRDAEHVAEHFREEVSDEGVWDA
jgi:hypothetical protein